MRLLYSFHVPSKIKVKDSKGNVWEVEQADCKSRSTCYFDYQGPNVYGEKLSVTTPAEHGGETLVVPPFHEWKEGIVFDGVLRHPGGSIRWV